MIPEYFLKLCKSYSPKEIHLTDTNQMYKLTKSSRRKSWFSHKLIKYIPNYCNIQKFCQICVVLNYLCYMKVFMKGKLPKFQTYVHLHCSIKLTENIYVSEVSSVLMFVGFWRSNIVQYGIIKLLFWKFFSKKITALRRIDIFQIFPSFL